MRYGYFDDDAREYVIERPDTPMSWVNYLGSGEYCSIVSNNGAGYSFHRSAKSGRLTRFRFNSVPMDRPGRYVYLRDAADGDYWSITWQPVSKPLDQIDARAAHGLGYSRFQSSYRGIESRMTVFVPLDDPIEVWDVRIENKSDRPRELGATGYAEWCFWDMMQDAFNFQYILYTCRMGYEADIIDYSIRLWPFREPKAFFASTLPVHSFDTDREVFLGPYRHEGRALAVERGRCSDSIAIGGTPCGALQSSFVLGPGERLRFAYVLGVGDAKSFGKSCRARFADPATTDAELARITRHFDQRLGKLSCRTPSHEVDSMVNVWNQLQCQTTFNWSRSASFNEAGGRDGLGYRDSNQDTLGVVHSIPALVRARLLELLSGQLSSGAAMHSFQPLGFTQGGHNAEGAVFSDDHLWLLLSVPAYLKETGDFALLDEVVPYADAGAASVFAHLGRALDFSWSKRGPHGLLLGLAADWNDCLNLRGNGESMFSTLLYLHALDEFLKLATRLGRSAQTATFREQKSAVLDAVAEHAWDGDWFLRGYLDDGKPLGGKASAQSKIFMNSQSWAVIAGVGTREQRERAMDSLREHLGTEHGIVLNSPAYREHDPAVGAVTCFPTGLKENGGIFCHANTWAVVAEALLGRGDRAFEHYRSFLPAAKNDTADRYTMEPYVYSQFITGKEHPNFGRARNSWLTGTAAWGFVAITQYILGVRADYDGLLIAPAIPSKWNGYEVMRVFRDATYHIRVNNPHHVSSGVARIKVDGRIITTPYVPPAPAGSTVAVEVELGRAKTA